MRRLLLFIMMMGLFATAARLELICLKQQEAYFHARSYMRSSAYIALGIKANILEGHIDHEGGLN